MEVAGNTAVRTFSPPFDPINLFPRAPRLLSGGKYPYTRVSLRNIANRFAGTLRPLFSLCRRTIKKFPAESPGAVGNQCPRAK